MKTPRRPPHLFWLAVRNIRCATLIGLHLPEGKDDGPAHAWLRLELHKPMPTSDFHRCLVSLVSDLPCADVRGGSGVVCAVEMVAESPGEVRSVELQIVPIRRNEEFAPKKGLGLTSNESAFQALAMQAPMYGKHLNQLVERIEFAAEEDPEACEHVPHGVPIPTDIGEYPELTYIQADLCVETDDGSAPESASGIDIEFDLIDGPAVTAVMPRQKRTTIEQIFHGVVEFYEELGRKVKPVTGER